jgi:flavoprotein
MPDDAWERAVLMYDPAAGDKDGGDIRVLSDRIVTARSGGVCWQCGEGIVPGTRVRAEAAVVDGRMRRCRTCHACCDAMATSWTDAGEAIEARIAGMRKRRGY